MAAALPLLMMMVLPNTGLSVNVVSKDSAFEASSLGVMGQVFQRSEKVHQQSMGKIMRSMSVAKAVGVLEKGHRSNTVLMQATKLAVAGNTNLRKQPKGYSGIDGTRA